MSEAFPFIVIVSMLVALFMLVGCAVFLFYLRHSTVNQKIDKLDSRGELLHNDVVDVGRSVERMHDNHKEIRRICDSIKSDTATLKVAQ